VARPGPRNADPPVPYDADVASAAWPLVGRASALDLACAALAGGSDVLVTGPLGVGRTRLAEEVLARAEARGDRVVRLTVTRAAATIPFGAATPLLPTGEAEPDAGSSTTGTLLAARQAFAERARDGVVLVGVDDAHLLDEATATLLAALAEDGHIRLVLTVRSGDHVPEAVDALWRGKGWCHIELAELTEAEVRELLTQVLDGEVESATVERLWEATRGNVLFLRELCRDAIDAGTLALRHGVWAWAPGPFTGPRLHDLVAGRIGALTVEERHVAGLLALGEPLSLGLLGWLADAGAVAAMRDRGLIEVERVEGRQVARLAHPLYADGMRAQLGPLETADLYATLVRGTLAEAGTHVAGPPDATHLDPEERLRLAVWSISSNVEADPGLLAAAAADAREHDDPALAERLARAALGQTPSTGIARPPAPVPPPCVVSFNAALTLGEALGDLQRPEEAEAVLRPLAGLARTDADRTRVAVAQLAALRLVPGGADRAREVAAGAGVTDPTGDDVVRATLADTLSHLGALDEAGRLASDLLKSGAPEVRPRAVAAATIWLAHIGRSDRAVDVATQTSPPPPAPAGRGTGARRRSPAASAIVGLVAGGRVTEAEAAVDRAVADPVSRRHLYRGTLALLRGRIALSRGRPATARTALGEAAVVLGRADQLGRHAWALTLLAEAHALLGDGQGADDSLRARTTWGQSERYRRDIQRAEVWALVARGDAASAASRALSLADDCRAVGHTGYELTFLDLALRLGADEAAARALAVAPAVEGPFAPAFAAFCTALSAGDGAALDAAAARYARLGLDLHAAEAATHAARAYHRAGDPRRAGEARVHARRLAERCEGARTPALAGGSLAGDLTPREREVALLAGQGLSSRAIAERLEVSVRTVDNQLGRAYRKLGVTSRAELAELLAPDA
jgi:DNA-binding CsgD family transcriptional regulator